MKLYTIDLTSWTASFRYPNLISGFQPTLEVPPISTVLGLINAAAGRYLPHQQLTIGYYFQYGAKCVDLETIYQIEVDKRTGQPNNNVNTNIMRREFMFDTFLRIYTNQSAIAGYFRQPYFPLVMGRMNDLATVERISDEAIDFAEVTNATQIRGQVVPFTKNYLPGTIQALPKYFTDTIPRQNIGTEPYSVLNWQTRSVTSRLSGVHDKTLGKDAVDVYLHQLDFSAFELTN
ncbi:type I-B CRISPR-associated protein Cas5b [Spirosoma soli]|uniref:Type I-B CRISPR-associated protein Cas5b n=1 Tax=Spirosoma soli TaxID=1770529 RepID=A0ABW5M0C5_9BACT